MLIQEESGTITTASGTAFATIQILRGQMTQVVITPATATTEYDFTITNNLGFVVVDRDDVTGSYNESFVVPMKEPCTLTITNASADEAFTYYVSLVERYE